MKRIVVLAISFILLLTGCGKKSSEDLINKFKKDVLNSKSYVLKGNMEVISNEEVYTYSLEVDFLKDNFYKVTLVNQTNNHEQIILRNKEGIYVVTRALNKSFKFQSEWPDTGSQAYILASIIKDIENDKDKKFMEQDKGYVLKTKVNYPNNSELTYQKIYFDKNMNLENLEVYNDKDIAIIKLAFSKINLKANLKEEEFKLEELINCEESSASCSKNNESTNNKNCETEECDTKSSNILDIIYPLYVPSETYLSNSEKIDTDDGNRVILTFAGNKNFVLIEEVANTSSEFEIIPVYGEPVMLKDTIAAKSANSMYWTSDNISYYLTSSDLSTSEMVTIAESLGNTKNVSVGASK